MKVTIEQQVMGFRVELGPGEEFDQVLTRLKESVPKAHRHFSEGHWFVEKRAQKQLVAWQVWLVEFGIEVITLRTQTRDMTSSAA